MLTEGKETYTLIDESSLIDNENANYFEKNGNLLYLGWKSPSPSIPDLHGTISDLKFFPREAFLSED